MGSGHGREEFPVWLTRVACRMNEFINRRRDKAASHYKLDNLCAVVDRNRLQISGNTEDVMAHDDLHERFRAFGWHVIDVADGNDISQLKAAFEEAKETKGRPTVLIANTVKGKGSPVMEHKAGWHHKVPNQEELAQIRKDLKERKEALLHE